MTPELQKSLILVCEKFLGYKTREFTEGVIYWPKDFEADTVGKALIIDANLAHEVKQAMLKLESRATGGVFGRFFSEIESQCGRYLYTASALLNETPELIILSAAKALEQVAEGDK